MPAICLPTEKPLPLRSAIIANTDSICRIVADEERFTPGERLASHQVPDSGAFAEMRRLHVDHVFAE